MDLTIRAWAASDGDVIRPQILLMLQTLTEKGHVIAPTRENATRLWSTGCSWSAAGEPTLLAEREGRIVGWVLWGPVPGDMQLNYNVCHGLGTFVLPEERRQHVSRALRERAEWVACERGYDVVIGTAFDTAGLNSSLKMGFLPVGVEVRRWLRS